MKIGIFEIPGKRLVDQLKRLEVASF